MYRCHWGSGSHWNCPSIVVDHASRSWWVGALVLSNVLWSGGIAADVVHLTVASTREIKRHVFCDSQSDCGKTSPVGDNMTATAIHVLTGRAVGENGFVITRRFVSGLVLLRGGSASWLAVKNMRPRGVVRRIPMVGRLKFDVRFGVCRGLDCRRDIRASGALKQGVYCVVPSPFLAGIRNLSDGGGV